MEVISIVILICVMSALHTAKEVAEIKYGSQVQIKDIESRLVVVENQFKGVEHFDKLKEDINQLKIKIGLSI